jgi:predicted  nucleic acid-binding Zn-ribbon protein
MSNLDKSMETFSHALDQLEAALNRQSLTEKSAEAMEKEIAVLKEDRSRLAQELDAARSELAVLASTAGRIGGQVDSAIEEIEAVLAQ